MADVHTTCRSPGLVRDGFPYDRTTPWPEISWVAAEQKMVPMVPSSQRHGHLTTGATWPLGTSWPKCPQCKRAGMCRSPVKRPWLRTTWALLGQSSFPSRHHGPCGQATYSRASVPHKVSGEKNLSGHTSYALLPPRHDLPCSNLKLQVLSQEVSEPLALSSANTSRFILSRFDTNTVTPNHWFSH